MSRSLAGLTALAGRFEPQQKPVAVGRTLLATAQLSLLLFSPDATLFAREPDLPYGPGCDGIRRLSIWCVAGQSGATVSVGHFVAIIVLLVVASGFRPRWTCVPHWYVAFSLNLSVIAPNGGERACHVATLLLIPLMLGDRRTWHWQGSDPRLSPDQRGSAYAAHLVLRGQTAIIYLMAAISKWTNANWRHGQAMRVILDDPQFGVSPGMYGAFRSFFDSPRLTAAVGWGVILTEAAIGLSMAGPLRARQTGLALAVALHTAIIALMGLASFGLVMIGLVSLTVVSSPKPTPPRPDMASPTKEPEANVDRDHAVQPV